MVSTALAALMTFRPPVCIFERVTMCRVVRACANRKTVFLASSWEGEVCEEVWEEEEGRIDEGMSFGLVSMVGFRVSNMAW